MQTTSGLLTYLSQRIGPAGLVLVLLMALAVAIIVALAVLALGELVVAGADPVQVSPVRWLRRV
ncbi:MAG: hypothetical protein AB1Z67_03660 [Candidatus Limnocylindrales bacterium]